MNKKLNMFLRILTVVAVAASGYFAWTLKGKVSTALEKTAWTVNDEEIKAPKDFDGRIKALAETKTVLETKRKRIEELSGNVKDLQADVADKKTKIEGLTANVATLEGERAELTRKRDEAVAQLTDANSKKDAAVAELGAAKEELVKEKEKTASLFTEEQLEEQSAKAKHAEESLDIVKTKYAALYNYAASRTDTKIPLPRDPLAAEAAPDATGAAVVVQANPTDTVLTKVVTLDSKTGLVAFSVGEQNNIKNGTLFDVLVNGVSVGKVRICSVKTALSFAQISPEEKSDLKALSSGSVVTLAPL